MTSMMDIVKKMSELNEKYGFVGMVRIMILGC